jgi:hypothetical protein
VKPFSKVIASLFGTETFSQESARSRQIHREWDRQRALATSPSERAEIDAIFARNL